MLSPSHFLLYPKGYYCLILKSNKVIHYFLKKEKAKRVPDLSS